MVNTSPPPLTLREMECGETYSQIKKTLHTFKKAKDRVLVEVTVPRCGSKFSQDSALWVCAWSSPEWPLPIFTSSPMGARKKGWPIVHISGV
jgi:hypothetical protein